MYEAFMVNQLRDCVGNLQVINITASNMYRENVGRDFEGEIEEERRQEEGMKEDKKKV